MVHSQTAVQPFILEHKPLYRPQAASQTTVCLFCFFFVQSSTSCRCRFQSRRFFRLSLSIKPVVQVTSCEDDPVIPPLSSLEETRTRVLLCNRPQHTGGCFLSSRLDCEQPLHWRDIVTTGKTLLRALVSTASLPLICIHERIYQGLFT